MATIQVRVDDGLKAEADSLFSSLGLDTSTAVRMFLAAALYNGGIPFAVKRISEKSPSAEIRQAIARRKAGEKLYTIEECVAEMDEAIAMGGEYAAN